MGKPEAHVEKYLFARVKEHGGMCLKFTSGISGVPDRIIILNGRTLFVEAKAPGKTPEKLQRVQHERMRAAGADVRVIDNRADVDELLDELIPSPIPLERKKAA